MYKWKKIARILEFFLFGLIVGIIEDLIAINISTGATITLKIVGIVTIIAFFSAVLGELIIDRIDLAKILKENFSKNPNEKEIQENKN